jgi:hypothetical protein
VLDGTPTLKVLAFDEEFVALRMLLDRRATSCPGCGCRP